MDSSSQPPAQSTEQFRRELFPAEMADVRARRAAADLREPPSVDGPSTSLGLVGLALSGGGIRSATFSLGVVQGLARAGLLRTVDFLSTVSGGGFIGSAVSALMNDPASHADGPSFPLRTETGRPDPPAVRHLRNSQHYLAPGGALDSIRIPALMARGILLNFLMIVPYVMLIVSLTDLIYGGLLTRPRGFFIWMPLVTAVAFAVIAISYPVILRIVGARMPWSERDRYERITALAFLIAVLALVLSPVFAIVDEAVWMVPDDVGRWIQDSLPALLPRLGVAAAVVAFISFVAGFWPRTRQLRTLIALYAVGVLGPAVPVTLYLFLCVLVIDPPGTTGEVAAEFARPALAEEITAFDRGTIPPDLLNRTLPPGDPGPPLTLDPKSRVEIVAPGQHWQIHGPSQSVIATAQPRLRFWREQSLSGAGRILVAMNWVFLGIAVAWLLIGAVFGNVNASSAHGFYRDRLSQAYLIRRTKGPKEAVEAWDGLKLSDLCQEGTRAPYHLINASLNLNGTTDADVRGRNCDFFLFSKRFTGSTRLGYAPTRHMERLHPHLNVGTAVAISGAAASPNAGVTTITQLAFILTILDVRLGYWLPNPGCVRDAGPLRKLQLWLGTGPSYLLREALQMVSSGGSFVNLSDGGHIENLAIYQLLRRRCRLIVAVDGEQDGDLYFDGLMRLLLYARIDLGVDVDIDVSAIRRQASEWSGLHYAIGTITYGATADGHRDEGWLLYLKSSMTGDEDEVMRDYHRSHPLFPHETTANQFFNERQWEMYRSLGLHVVTSALGNTGDPRIVEIQRFLAGLGKDSGAHA